VAGPSSQRYRGRTDRGYQRRKTMNDDIIYNGLGMGGALAMILS